MALRALSVGDALPGPQRVTVRSREPRPKEASSPYFDVPEDGWEAITRELIEAHPLATEEIVTAAEMSWASIFESNLGEKFHIGVHIFPKPQVIGFFLHELIPLHIEDNEYEFRAERSPSDKDIVCETDDRFSIEIKTSSHKNRIFANRSYGQTIDSEWKKSKSGYYIAVNFESWPSDIVKPADPQVIPSLYGVRFGWLDHTDWYAQASSTGQQSSLPPVVEKLQLLRIGIPED